MIQVHFKTQDGSVTSAVGTDGESVMEIARNNGIHGIVAECGGAAMCATCHVYVSPGWLARIPPVSEFEDELLEGTGAPRMENSRLGCQIKLSDTLDGLEVTVPASQY